MIHLFFFPEISAHGRYNHGVDWKELCISLEWSLIKLLFPGVVFSAVSGLELSMSREQHKCKFSS